MSRKMKSWGLLVGLEGMPPKIRAWHASSRTEAIDVLRAKRAVTAAGDNGALTVWRPRSGGIRAEFQTLMVTQSSETFTSVAQLRRWLAVWWPKLGR